jgi:hypothetical protein
MSKSKFSEIIKVLIVSIMTIMLFCVSFIGINGFALAAVTNRIITMPPPSEVSNNILSYMDAAPKNYPSPVITVIEPAYVDARLNNINALSAEQAAELGAQCIWEVLGENIDGKTVYMSYSILPSNAKLYWVGMVMDSSIEAGSTRESFIQFMINAVSGERASIHDMRINGADLPAKPMTLGEYNELLTTTLEKIGRYEQLAKEYAQKYFNLTDVKDDITFNGMQVVTANGDRNSNNNVILYRDTLLSFTVADQRGREAKITVSMETDKLYNLTTQHNDFIPGFEHSDGQRDEYSAVPIPNSNDR